MNSDKNLIIFFWFMLICHYDNTQGKLTCLNWNLENYEFYFQAKKFFQENEIRENHWACFPTFLLLPSKKLN